MLSLSDIVVSYPSRAEPVLDGCSFDLRPGEHVLLLGPSGSGKSTALQAISGVIPLSVNAERLGTVSFDGVDTLDTTVAERSRSVGVLAQDPAAAVCLPRVDDEIALVLENRGTPVQQISGRIDETLDSVGAGALRERSTAELSGGEAQRVALAAALAGRPEVLLLDEPTSMLDSAGVRSVRTALAAAVERYAPAVVLVEHRLDEFSAGQGAAGLPSRTVVLDGNGRTVADGETRAVLQERAAMLHDLGCWLPLDAELFALTATPGGLDAEPNRRFLADLSSPAGPSVLPERSTPVLVATALDVGRPTGVVCAGISLSVRAGEIVAVVGANGSGKSTLLHTLAGLLKPVTGTVTGDRAGLVFQNPEHQFAGRTVETEIGHGLPVGTRREIVDRLLHRHRLAHLRDQNPWRLSGGEKRRLSLAAMLAHERPVLLADEPTFGLDRRDTAATAAALAAAADEGAAVVFSSHDLRVVAQLADRVILVGEGRVLGQGATTEVLGDAALCERAGIRLPALVAHLLAHAPTTADLRETLSAFARARAVVA